MPHVVTQNCALCRYTECVEICPVDCFHGDAARLWIDPAVCIDCGACIPACPVRAIADAFDLGPAAAHWVEENRRHCAALPVIAQKEAPLPTAPDARAALGY